MTDFLDQAKLNPEQRSAAECTEGALLILAGAGSGKTRVLTYRTGHLLLDNNVSPWNVLAITFTNKAAREMRERIEKMCGRAADGIIVSTFHSLCVRILRTDAPVIGYTRNFTIYDDDDTGRVITAIIKELGIDTKSYPPKAIKAAISNAKNACRSVEDLRRNNYSEFARILPDIMERYERTLKKNNAFDFDDLILKTNELFAAHPEVLEKYSDRFRYIMVDEYQDTNISQYMLVRSLGSRWKNVCVVGDDDQSIYGWRGADISIIRNFEKDYKNARMIKLEQNYRSTGNILDAANAVIKNNTDRKEKKLWSQNSSGDKIDIHQFSDDREEAVFVARTIEREIRNGKKPSDIAILYRLNATSRNLENSLMAQGVRFRIYGGMRFYDRAEVKDALAYLRVIINPHDEVSIKRIINVPRRGIGDSTVQEIQSISQANDISMLEVMQNPEKYGVKMQTAVKLHAFCYIINECASLQGSPADTVRFMIERTGLSEQYRNEDTEEAVNRRENLAELINDAVQFNAMNPEGKLEDYLEQVALVADIEENDEKDAEQGAVSMMTVHSAKGLEFDTVFMVAFEDGIFPISRAFDTPGEMEEERRLAYVAITRCKRSLYITSCRRRMLHGHISDMMKSRFLREIPSQLTTFSDEAAGARIHQPFSMDFTRTERPEHNQYGGHDRSEARLTRPPKEDHRQTIDVQKAPSLNNAYAVGERVKHKKFGEGRIIGVKGSGADTVLQVAFVGNGIKELAAAYAPLEKL